MRDSKTIDRLFAAYGLLLAIIAASAMLGGCASAARAQYEHPSHNAMGGYIPACGVSLPGQLGDDC